MTGLAQPTPMPMLHNKISKYPYMVTVNTWVRTGSPESEAVRPEIEMTPKYVSPAKYQIYA